MDAVALTTKALDMSAVKADTTVKFGVVDTTVTGGAGADKIDMVATWTTKDTIDGGAGSDTLVVREADARALKATSTSNIEWLEVSGTINSSVPINADYWGGISNVRFTGTNTKGVVTNLKEAAEIELDGAAANTTLSLKAPNGTADSINLDLDGGGVTYTLTASNIETINVEANGVSGTSTLGLTAAQLKTLNITQTADQAFDTGTLGTVVAVVDASAFTAATASNGVTVTLSTSAVNGATVTGSANNDTITGSSVNDTLNGGLGVDTIDGLGGADTVDGGAGADEFVIGKGGLDSMTGGTGADDYLVSVATTFSTAADKTTITDFDAGTATTTVDQIDLDISTLNAIATTGTFATTITELANGNSANIQNAGSGGNAALVLQTLTGEGVVMATASEMMLIDIGTYATDAKIKAAFAASELSFTFGSSTTDNDGILIAYKTGTDINIAVAQIAGTGTSSDGIDGVETFITLAGITDFTNIDTGDFIVT
jgi:Ca2+-binding RTX toxin-like protein